MLQDDKLSTVSRIWPVSTSAQCEAAKSKVGAIHSVIAMDIHIDADMDMVKNMDFMVDISHFLWFLLDPMVRLYSTVISLSDWLLYKASRHW